MQIIDCHCHYGQGDGLIGPWDTRASIKKFMQWSKEAGIHKTNLFSAFHSNYTWANEQVGKMVKQHPNLFFGFSFIHPERDAGRVFQMIKRDFEEFQFRGIKVHRHDARITREICEVAKIFKIPVLYDVVGETSVIELLATEYPTVNFIIPHLGSFADDWRAQLNLIPMLERYGNIYTDTSGIRRFDLLAMAVERAGASKILFGTDGPWLHPSVELEKIFALKLTLQEEELVLGKNFLQLISNAQRQNMPKFVFDYRKNTALSRQINDPWLPQSEVLL